MDRIQRLVGGMGGAAGGPPADTPQVDTAEQIYISSLALLKMLKHGGRPRRAGRGWGTPSRRRRARACAAHPRDRRAAPRHHPAIPARGGGGPSRPLSPTPPTPDRRPRRRPAGRAGVPMEVMGLMLGEFVDDYTVRVVDVFAMPQSGTGVSVEAVDPVFQTKMLDMLKQVGRCAGGGGNSAAAPAGAPAPVGSCGARALTAAPRARPACLQARDGGGLVPQPPRLWLLAVGHGHQHAAGAPPPLRRHRACLNRRWAPRTWPGPPAARRAPAPAAALVPPALTSRPRPHLAPPPPPPAPRPPTAQSFEALNQRAVAVVVDPIQSVKGKVVIDAFRLISAQTMMLAQEPRQTTSNLGHLNKPSIAALIHGLNRHYYSIAINYRKNELEERMLLNLSKKSWTSGLTLHNFQSHTEENEKVRARGSERAAPACSGASLQRPAAALGRAVLAARGGLQSGGHCRARASLHALRTAAACPRPTAAAARAAPMPRPPT
jgi:hypothetical protein